MPKTHTTDQLQRKVSQLEALHRVSVAMASMSKREDIIKLVVDEVVALTGATSAVVLLVDPQSQALVPDYAIGNAGAISGPLDMNTSDDLAVQVAHVREPATRVIKETSGGISPKMCRVAVPIVAGEEALGVLDLTVNEDESHHDLIEMLVTLASQAGQVLRNALTHQELQAHYRELSLLYEIQQEIVSTFDYQNVLDLIVERIRRLLNASECTIRLLREHEGKRFIRIAATTGRQFIGPEEVPFEESLIDHQVLGGELIYMENIQTDPRFRWKEEAKQAGVVSMICAPLIARRRIIGTIRIYTAERREFSVAERKMVHAVAGQAATAIHNARLLRGNELKNRELLESNQALRRTQRELIRKERLAALGEMAATVAHEIRNPLTSIRGFAQRIARRYADKTDERLGEYTGIIIEEVDRLDKFIKDVLDFARRAKPTFEKASVNKILSEIVTLMRDELAGRGVMVVADLDMNIRETVMDAALIKQALLNVLQNARQAIGGKNGMIIIKTNNQGPYVRIRIADNGGGISRENLHKIFSPFFTTKVSGTGLGLALVHRTIDDHHGKIFVRSRLNYGTVVDISMPVVESEDAILALA